MFTLFPHPPVRCRGALPILLLWSSIIANWAACASLHIDFLHEVDGKPLIIDSLRYDNSRSETFSVTRLAWLATGFSLTTSSGDRLVILFERFRMSKLLVEATAT